MECVCVFSACAFSWARSYGAKETEHRALNVGSIPQESWSGSFYNCSHKVAWEVKDCNAAGDASPGYLWFYIC